MKAKKIIAAFVSALSLNTIAAASMVSTQITASAATTSGTYNNFTYNNVNGEITITGYKGTATSITIPATINGTKVKAIADDFMKDNQKITSVVVSKGIETIGDNFFSNSKKLSSVYVKNGVKSFGKNFCSYNDNLVTVVLPYTLETMGDYCFYGCDYYTNNGTDTKRLKTLKFYNSSDTTTTDSNVSHVKALGTGTLWQTDWERQSSNMIIGQYLYRCVNLNNVTGFNASTGKLTMSTFDGHCIQYIGRAAFEGKKQIKSVDLSPVLYIDRYAFQNCTNLATFTNANAVMDIGVDALKGTKWLSNNTNTYVTLGRTLYKFASTATNCDLSGANSSICSISENAFNGSNVTTIDLGGVNHINNNALSYANGSKLTTVKRWGSPISDNDFYENLYGLMGSKYAINRCEAKAKQIIQGCGLTWRPSGTTTVAYKKKAIKKLREYACTNWHYEHSNGNQEVEGALLFNKGVCASFSLAYAYLLENCGVNAQVVHGKGHAWNIVEYAPGKWGHVDITTIAGGSVGNKDVLYPNKRFIITDAQRYVDDHETSIYWSISDTTNMHTYNIYDSTTHRTGAYPFGDLNNDKNVNNTDATRLTNYLNTSITLTDDQLIRADIDLNGSVNATDLTLLKQYLLNK